VEELQRTMAKAGEELQDLQTANQRAGAMVAAMAARSAPRRSGRLAGSIRAERTRGGATITSGLAYAGAIHWGWPSRHIDPQPYITLAAQATEDQWLKLYEQEIDRTLEKVKGA
jgi:phage gpG-like protein